MKTQLTLIAGLIACHAAVAADEFRQHDAHVHGQVEFNIAQDGNDLLIEITAPGADVVGFEHAPENDADKLKITNAVKTLEAANGIFTIPSSANCVLADVHINNTLESDDEHDDHTGHDHDKHDEHHDHDHEKHHDDHKDHDHHDHDKHHDDHKDHDHHDHDEHHDDHKGHEHHDHDEHSGHGEFTAQYQFSCQNIDKLEYLDTQWFTVFPSTEKVSVNLLTESAQSAAELTSQQTRIKF